MTDMTVNKAEGPALAKTSDTDEAGTIRPAEAVVAVVAALAAPVIGLVFVPAVVLMELAYGVWWIAMA